MTRSNRNRNNQNPTPSKERDWVLTALLAIINLGSGTTTVLGAMQFLPRALAWGLGGTIQLMLFLLLGEYTAKHAPFRKWVAVTALTFMSVYTSFFTYYKQLAGETNDKLAHEKAVLAHQNFVKDVYTPMKDHHKQLEDEAKKTRELAKAEKDRGIDSGVVGYGDRARALDRQALDLEIKANNFKSTVDELRPKFDYDITQLQPREILQKDGKTLAEVPAEWRKDYPELPREKYIDAELDVDLFTPYYKVKRFEDPAIASMGIAFVVDGIAIMLGTAITIKRERKTLAQLIVDFIRQYKRDIAEVIQEIKESPNLDNPSRNDTPPSRETIERVPLILRGKGSNFLTEFYTAISVTQPHIINYQALINHENETFQRGFRFLLDKFREPRRGWVQVNNQNDWLVAPQHYDKLTAWLRTEISHHTQEEEHGELKGDWGLGVQETTVIFTIPSINNSR